MTKTTYTIQGRYHARWEDWEPTYTTEKVARWMMKQALEDGWWKKYQLRLVRNTTTTTTKIL